MKLLIPQPKRQAVERCPTDKQVFKCSWDSVLGLCLKDLTRKIIQTAIAQRSVSGERCMEYSARCCLSLDRPAIKQERCHSTGRKRVLGLKKYLATEDHLKQLSAQQGEC